jgi:hypothetical protein
VEDLDREVLLDLTEDVLVLLLDNPPGAMVRVDDGVADLEVDALRLGDQVVQVDLFGVDGFGNGGPPRSTAHALTRAAPTLCQVCK